MISLRDSGLRSFFLLCQEPVSRNEQETDEQPLEEQQAAAACVTYGMLLRQRADAPGASEKRLLLSHVQGRIGQESYDLCLRAAGEAGAVLTAFYNEVFVRESVEMPVASLTSSGV